MLIYGVAVIIILLQIIAIRTIEACEGHVIIFMVSFLDYIIRQLVCHYVLLIAELFMYAHVVKSR